MSAPKVTITDKNAQGGFYVEVDDVYSPGWFPTREEAEAYAEDIRQGRKDAYTPAEEIRPHPHGTLA